MRAQSPLTTFALASLASSLLMLMLGCGDRYHREDRYREELKARCGSIIDRIEYDRRKLGEIEPGRHEKARQWYLDDVRNAERDLDRCRHQLR